MNNNTYLIRCGIVAMILGMSACAKEDTLRPAMRNLGPESVPRMVVDEAVVEKKSNVLIAHNDAELVAMLFQYNAELQAQSFSRDASFAAREASDNFPATTFKIMPLGDFAQTAAGEVQGAVGVEQMFPAFGVRRSQRNIADQQYSAREAQVDALKLRLVQDLRKQLSMRQESIDVFEILKKNQELLNDILEVVNVRLAHGGAERNQILEVETRLSELAQSSQQWQARRLDAEARIRRVLGVTQSAVFPVQIQLHQMTHAIQKEQALLILRQQHPQLRIALAVQAAAIYGQDLAKASGRPAFMLGLSYTWVDDAGLSPVHNGDDQWAMNIGIRIPLDRGAVRARQQAASLRVQQEQWNTVATKQELEQEFASAWALYNSAQQRWVLSTHAIVPKSQERFELVEAGYQTGKSTYIDVMDAWRQVLQASIHERQLYYTQLRQHYQLLSRMGMLFSQDVHRLVAPSKIEEKSHE